MFREVLADGSERAILSITSADIGFYTPNSNAEVHEIVDGFKKDRSLEVVDDTTTVIFYSLFLKRHINREINKKFVDNQKTGLV